jgi:hypothetical protein
MNLESADNLQHLKERVDWILMGKQGAKMNTYRFSVEKYYVVKAISFDEAVELLNDKNEYTYLVNEEWQLLSEEEGVSA